MSLKWVTDLRTGIPTAATGDRRQLAARLAALGRLDAAAAVLEGAAGDATGPELRNQLVREATTLRARLN